MPRADMGTGSLWTPWQRQCLEAMGLQPLRRRNAGEPVGTTVRRDAAKRPAGNSPGGGAVAGARPSLRDALVRAAGLPSGDRGDWEGWCRRLCVPELDLLAGDPAGKRALWSRMRRHRRQQRAR